MPNTQPLYVGYLPIPPKHRVFVFSFVIAMAVMIPSLAGAIAFAQRSPGAGVWDLAAEQTWTGLITDDPYPALIADDGQTYLLVGVGKFGVHHRITPHNNTWVSITGYPITRNNRLMIEVGELESSIAPADRSKIMPELPLSPKPLAISLTTEIIDGKCYLGAMKPGTGPTHKACAILCVEGGLPPLVAYADETTGFVYPLLLINGSANLPEDILALVGEPVFLEGVLSTQNGIPILDANPASIKPASD